nr:ion channel [Candidatus Contendobacter sp.]
MNPEAYESTLFLALRRMRAPLITLILIYAVSILGLTIVPSLDAEGNPSRMSFLHAFYFISYTATTIGFGEIPNAFSEAQRMWVTFCIYLSVIGWAYFIGALLALLQDQNFRNAVRLQRFGQAV